MDESKKLDRIKAILGFSKYGEGFLELELYDDDIFACLANIGKTLCTEFIPGDSDFYLVDSVRKQAVTIHECSTICVYRGMLNFIFKTASLVAAVAHCTTEAPAEGARPWAQNVAHWLEEGGFSFEDERYWWLRSPDHRIIFNYCVKNIFRFVVLHEIGHLHNIHGIRRNKQKGQQPSFPDTGHTGGERNDSISLEMANNCSVEQASEDFSLHIREIVADTYAFQFFLDGLIEESDVQTNNSEDATNASKCSGVILAVHFVQLYFWLSDVMQSSRTNFILNGEKYPPQAFRMQSIESTLLEHGNRFLPAKLVQQSLAQAILQTQTISKHVCRTEDFITWRIKLSDSVFLKHYERICQGVPKWANEVFGTYD